MLIPARKIIHLLSSIDHRLELLTDAFISLAKKESILMATLADIQTKASATLAQVQADTSIVNAVKTVVDNQNASLAALKAQIQQLIDAGTADPAALQALANTVDAIASTDMQNSDVVSAAVAAGTPAATTP